MVLVMLRYLQDLSLAAEDDVDPAAEAVGNVVDVFCEPLFTSGYEQSRWCKVTCVC